MIINYYNCSEVDIQYKLMLIFKTVLFVNEVSEFCIDVDKNDLLRYFIREVFRNVKGVRLTTWKVPMAVVSSCAFSGTATSIKPSSFWSV